MKLKPQKQWIIKEILDLIEDENKLRRKDVGKYKRIKNLII